MHAVKPDQRANLQLGRHGGKHRLRPGVVRNNAGIMKRWYVGKAAVLTEAAGAAGKEPGLGQPPASGVPLYCTVTAATLIQFPFQPKAPATS